MSGITKKKILIILIIFFSLHTIIITTLTTLFFVSHKQDKVVTYSISYNNDTGDSNISTYVNQSGTLSLYIIDNYGNQYFEDTGWEIDCEQITVDDELSISEQGCISYYFTNNISYDCHITCSTYEIERDIIFDVDVRTITITSDTSTSPITIPLDNEDSKQFIANFDSQVLSNVTWSLSEEISGLTIGSSDGILRWNSTFSSSTGTTNFNILCEKEGYEQGILSFGITISNTLVINGKNVISVDQFSADSESYSITCVDQDISGGELIIENYGGLEDLSIVDNSELTWTSTTTASPISSATVIIKYEKDGYVDAYLNITFNVATISLLIIQGDSEKTSGVSLGGELQYTAICDGSPVDDLVWTVEDDDECTGITIDNDGILSWQKDSFNSGEYQIGIKCSKEGYTISNLFIITFTIYESYFITSSDSLVEIPYSDDTNVLYSFCNVIESSSNLGILYGGTNYYNLKGFYFGDDWNSLDSVGDNFCSKIFKYCSYSNLEILKLPSNIIGVGSDFCAFMFQESSLTTLPNGFTIPTQIATFGVNAFFFMFYECNNLSSIPDGFNIPQNITNAGNYFCYGMFQDSTLTTLPSGFTFQEEINSVGTYFCSVMFADSSLTTLPNGFRFPINIASSYTFYGTFGNCQNITKEDTNGYLIFRHPSGNDGTWGGSCFGETDYVSTNFTDINVDGDGSLSVLPETNGSIPFKFS